MWSCDLWMSLESIYANLWIRCWSYSWFKYRCGCGRRIFNNINDLYYINHPVNICVIKLPVIIGNSIISIYIPKQEHNANNKYFNALGPNN